MQPVAPKTAQVSVPAADAIPKRLGVRSIERVGNTPLLRLERIANGFPNIELLGKAEWLNPGGSVKDRAAKNIVRKAQAAGQLGPGKILLDSTSGNTGIAFAMIGAAEGFPVTLCMPENVSVERKRILHAYGASKAGLVGLAKCLASELSTRGIRVNVLSPGNIRTPFWRTIASDEQMEAVLDYATQSIPLARLGEPEEIANAVLFLCSDESSYVHGTQLYVDGGITGAMMGAPAYRMPA